MKVILYPDRYLEILKLKSLLSWVWNITQTCDFDLGVYHAYTDYANQESIFHCFGCNTEYKSNKTPIWSTDFKHEPNCRYIELKNLMEKENDGCRKC